MRCLATNQHAFVLANHKHNIMNTEHLNINGIVLVCFWGFPLYYCCCLAGRLRSFFACRGGDLLSAIRSAGGGGMKLKKTVTVDKCVSSRFKYGLFPFTICRFDAIHISLSLLPTHSPTARYVVICQPSIVFQFINETYTAILLCKNINFVCAVQVRPGPEGARAHRTSPRFNDGPDDGESSNRGAR